MIANNNIEFQKLFDVGPLDVQILCLFFSMFSHIQHWVHSMLSLLTLGRLSIFRHSAV
jgi:hypothetical protein